jgi:hypothetical protein
MMNYNQSLKKLDPEVPGSIPGHYKEKKSSGSGTGSTQPHEYN